MQIKRSMLVLLTVLLLFGVVRSQVNFISSYPNELDGRYWSTLTEKEKHAFVSGYVAALNDIMSNFLMQSQSEITEYQIYSILIPDVMIKSIVRWVNSWYAENGVTKNLIAVMNYSPELIRWFDN